MASLISLKCDEKGLPVNHCQLQRDNTVTSSHMCNMGEERSTTLR